MIRRKIFEFLLRSPTDSPSGGAPVKAPRWDLADTEGYGGGNSFSWSHLMFPGYMGICRRKKYVGGRSRGPRGWGARRAPSWPPRLFLDFHSKSSRSRLFQKDRSQRFHSVWTLFDIPFVRNTEIGKKQQFWAGPPVNRLVPKII